MVVGRDEAIVSWLKTHEHIYAADATPGRPWTTIVVDATAAVLRGEYEVESIYRRNRPLRSRIIDPAKDGWRVGHARLLLAARRATAASRAQKTGLRHPPRPLMPARTRRDSRQHRP